MIHLTCFPFTVLAGYWELFWQGIFASSELGVFSGHGFAEGMTLSSQVKVQLIGILSTFALQSLSPTS